MLSWEPSNSVLMLLVAFKADRASLHDEIAEVTPGELVINAKLIGRVHDPVEVATEL